MNNNIFFDNLKLSCISSTIIIIIIFTIIIIIIMSSGMSMYVTLWPCHTLVRLPSKQARLLRRPPPRRCLNIWTYLSHMSRMSRVAFETLGPLNSAGSNFISDIGNESCFRRPEREFFLEAEAFYSIAEA